ncbi:DUF1579 domain-containing protein [Frigidibacter sp. RF13]|uniref:DUF1579 domain-containing protein n=1 Tax=Frigidibacter sp. RF13 TaxID=2997340 RepID=UPI0022719445|nr:DUF1579 domain-containing protein [Frigidibacter sp. RF13]MCY1127461.1 DUF1579 domain-containing protein [Frigidibacter sp. RF13]
MTAISHDFDFFFGRWKVQHRRLKHRLAGSDEWEEFDGSSEMWPTLGGNGNLDDNVVNIPSGSYRAITMRSFDPQTGTWAIWWLDARRPHQLDAPVIGRFESGVGTFYADDTFDGRPIKVRFLWLDTGTDQPRWEQAFSTDGGASWETNWLMRFTRAD